MNGSTRSETEVPQVVFEDEVVHIPIQKQVLCSSRGVSLYRVWGLGFGVSGLEFRGVAAVGCFRLPSDGAEDIALLRSQDCGAAKPYKIPAAGLGRVATKRLKPLSPNPGTSSPKSDQTHCRIGFQVSGSS